MSEEKKHAIAYIHLKSGERYFFQGECMMKVNDVWVEGVFYVKQSEIKLGDPWKFYVRAKKDFYKKFQKE